MCESIRTKVENEDEKQNRERDVDGLKHLCKRGTKAGVLFCLAAISISRSMQL